MTCPLCQKEIDPPAAACPRCRADVSLLVEHAAEVNSMREQSLSQPKAAEIASAIQTYLERLATNPADDEAYVALTPVLTALRSPARESFPRWATVTIAFAVAAAAFLAGLVCGMVFRFEGYSNV